MAWCPTCGSSHAAASTCSRDLLATGPERHGWRVIVETRRGIEACGILVAPAGHLWRARILTYPNILWTVPGGPATLKFLADDPRKAERAAMAFVQEHCRVRGHRILNRYPEGPGAPIEPEGTEGSHEREDPTVRKVRALPVRFGIQEPSRPALTLNLSEGGLFVSTSQPADAGLGLRLMLDVEGDWLPLRGLVVWNRLRPEIGRSLGMGMRLTVAPEEYLRFVRGIP